MGWLANVFKKVFPFLFPEPKVIMIPAPPTQFEEPTGNQELPSANDKGTMKLGIVVGHTRKSPGATMAPPYNISEYFWNTDLAERMVRYARAMHPTMQTEIYFRDTGGIAGAYAAARAGKCDCVIELHFNAFNGKALGTVTLCTPDQNDVAFAHVIQKAMVALYDRQGKEDRGVKALSKADRGGGNVHSFPGGANCLIEPFFGDNPSEAKMGSEKKEQLAKCLIDATALWARKVDLIKD